MRVLLACEFYFPSVGGVQEVMRQVAERLVRAGHEVIVASTRLAERQCLTLNGVQIMEFPVSGNLVRGMQGEVERYRAFVLQQDYDILMIKAAQQWTFDALIPVLDLIEKPKIFVPCGFSAFFDSAYAAYFRAMPTWLRKFDRLIFYASDYRDINLARSHRLSNVHILSNGADEREFNVEKDRSFRSRYSIPETAFLVMTVGTFTGLKGHIELAEAFERCDFGGAPACLLLIGNVPRTSISWRGWIRRWLEQARAMYRQGGWIRVAKWIVRPWLVRLGLEGLLVRLGYPPTKATLEVPLKRIMMQINAAPGRRAIFADLPRRDVVQAYLNSNLFVFASRIEYSPLVLFEAAAAGLPFLSVPVGNAAEIAERTGAGVICEAAIDADGYTRVDPAVLARCISALAAQPETLASLGRRGRKAWESHFSWSVVFRAYEKLFYECLEQSKHEPTESAHRPAGGETRRGSL